jgi:hypothetical protein
VTINLDKRTPTSPAFLTVKQTCALAMRHKLDFISRQDLIRAIDKIDQEGVPKVNEWSEYWITYKKRLYPFKYAVEVASSFTTNPIVTTDFTSNDSSRNYIAGLGFHIFFRTPTAGHSQIKFWIGASYYGPPEEQVDMLDEFLKEKFWRTDHDQKKDEGLKINELLQQVSINDRIGIRYFDKKGGTIRIAALGTVANISTIRDGRLGVNWDYNAPMFRGTKPSGPGSGNWWKTLFHLKTENDIENIFSETLKQKRAARLAWNYNGWVMPSGPFGKSKDPESHESKYGYGHEEWLFDSSKIIDGFHYGFLEPIRKQQNAFQNKSYNVWLYSIDGETKKRYWIGEINNIIVIDGNEAEFVHKQYEDKGWLKEMEFQIKACDANEVGFSHWKGIDLFNVKFKVADLLVNDIYVELPDDHPINSISRYNFAHFKKEFIVQNGATKSEFNFEPPKGEDSDDEQPVVKTHHREPKAVEIIYLHRAISKGLTKVLRTKHGYAKVTPEHPAGYGANKIDIVVNQDELLTFYEIKTYNALRVSIREALGQLIEYCFFPDKIKAVELVIVSQIPADADTASYFEHLRQHFNIKIYYQSFDLETKILSTRV